MATLTTTAVIRAHDQLTGPLNAMASKVAAINNRFRQGAAQLGGAVRNNMFAAGAGVLGITTMFQQAKAFEEKIFGVGVASIPDTLRDGGDAAAEAAVKMQAARVAAMGLSRALSMDPTVAAGIQESVAKAGVASDHVADFAKTIGMLKLTDKEANVEAISDWGASLSTLYREYMKLKGLNPAEFFNKAADAAAIGAAETSLSTGTFLEGLRQFAAVTASFGATPQQNAAWMAAAKKASGQNHIELGQTLKVMTLRLLSPTAQNLEAFNRLGLKRSDYFEGGSGSISAARATASLAAMTQGKLRGKERTFFLNEIERATRPGALKDDDAYDLWSNKMKAQLGKVLGLDMTQDANKERVTRMWESALVSGSGRVKFDKLFSDLAKVKDKDPTAVVSSFEQRRSAQIIGLLDAFKEDELGNSIYKQLIEAIEKSDGRMLKSALEAFDKSPYGRMMAMEAALKRFSVAIMGSRAATAVLNNLATALQSLDKLNPNALNFGVMAAMLGLIAGPAKAAAGGLLLMASAGTAAIASLARFAALPFLRMAAGLQAFSLGLGMIGMGGIGAAAAGLGAVLGIVARLVRFGVIAAAAGGIMAMIIGPEAAMAKLDEFMNGAAMQGLSTTFMGLMSSIDQLAQNFIKLFGIETGGSALMWGLTQLVTMLERAVGAVKAVTDATNQLLSSKDKVGTAKEIGSRIGNGMAPEEQKDGEKRIFGGLIGQMIDWLSPASNPLSPTADKLSGAADRLSAAADRLQTPPAPTVIQQGGGTGGPAQAPSIAPTNGAQYGRK